MSLHKPTKSFESLYIRELMGTMVCEHGKAGSRGRLARKRSDVTKQSASAHVNDRGIT